MRRSGKAGDGRPVHVIGHPNGLPLKVAGNARVTKNDGAECFESDVDALAASSGGPVFDSVTHEVEGIYVRSRYNTEHAYRSDGDCYTIRLVPATPGPGTDGPDEESTRVTLFSRLLGPGWQELDDNPATVAIAAGTPLGPTGLTVPSLYQLHSTGALWRYNGVPMVGWELLDTNQATAEVATDGSTLYQRHRGSGAIWRYTGTPLTGWQQLGNNRNTSGIAHDGLRLYQLRTDGGVWRYTGVPITGWEQIGFHRDTKALVGGGRELYQLSKRPRIGTQPEQASIKRLVR